MGKEADISNTISLAEIKKAMTALLNNDNPPMNDKLPAYEWEYDRIEQEYGWEWCHQHLIRIPTKM